MKEQSPYIGFQLRAKNIRRWPFMASFNQELLSTHIYEAAIIGHCLGVIAKVVFDEPINPDRVCSMAVHHEGAETAGFGDLPSPMKYRNPKATTVLKELEREFEQSLLDSLPPQLQESYRPLLQQSIDDPHAKLAKAADVICAYLKCQFELEKHNNEFADAMQNQFVILQKYRDSIPAVNYFCEVFLSMATSTLDKQASSDSWVENANRLAAV